MKITETVWRLYWLMDLICFTDDKEGGRSGGGDALLKAVQDGKKVDCVGLH